jgi:hypothetical protein
VGPRAALPDHHRGGRPHPALLQCLGRSASVLGGNRTSLDVGRLDAGGGRRTFGLDDGLLDGEGFAETLWQRDGNGLIVLSPNDGSATILSAAQGFRATGSWPALSSPLRLSDPAALLQLLPGGQQVVEVDLSGTIRFRDAVTGRVSRELPGPRDLAPTADQSLHRPQGWAALDAAGRHVAVLDATSRGSGEEKIVVTDTSTGRTRQLDGKGADGVAFAADHLLVQRDSGVLEIWSAAGDRRLGMLEGTPGTVVGPVAGGDLVVEKSVDDALHLIDLETGQAVGTLELPHGRALSTGMAFAADGSELVTATESGGDATGDVGTLMRVRLDPAAWVHAACAAAGRDLTAALWTQFLTTPAPSDLRCAR